MQRRSIYIDNSVSWTDRKEKKTMIILKVTKSTLS